MTKIYFNLPALFIKRFKTGFRHFFRLQPGGNECLAADMEFANHQAIRYLVKICKGHPVRFFLGFC
ncbi:hypothetical protein A9Q89_02590 [Gammaproteobacteria bacterium 53_120_T64]|nr:hypothetical protein A9Q89_02590 [Gammaproteobacteria bacterium 53_120_T64]